MSFSPRFSPDGDYAIMSIAKNGATNIYLLLPCFPASLPVVVVVVVVVVAKQLQLQLQLQLEAGKQHL